MNQYTYLHYAQKYFENFETTKRASHITHERNLKQLDLQDENGDTEAVVSEHALVWLSYNTPVTTAYYYGSVNKILIAVLDSGTLYTSHYELIGVLEYLKATYQYQYVKDIVLIDGLDDLAGTLEQIIDTQKETVIKLEDK